MTKSTHTTIPPYQHQGSRNWVVSKRSSGTQIISSKLFERRKFSLYKSYFLIVAGIELFESKEWSFNVDFSEASTDPQHATLLLSRIAQYRQDSGLAV